MQSETRTKRARIAKERETPSDFVLGLFHEANFILQVPKELPKLAITDAMIEAYQEATVSAAREGDLTALQEIYKSDENALECCNRFGESILHILSRRGRLDCVEFLLETAKVSLRIRDDYGRTCLHDACWSVTPNYELVKYLVSKEPRLLLIRDVRGHLPMQYVREEHADEWKRFWETNKNLLAIEFDSSSTATVP